MKYKLAEETQDLESILATHGEPSKKKPKRTRKSKPEPKYLTWFPNNNIIPQWVIESAEDKIIEDYVSSLD